MPARWTSSSLASSTAVAARRALFGAAALFAAMSAAAPTAVEARSFTGAFMAARMAEADNDYKAAARYYREALSFDPESTRLLNAAILLSVMAGDLEEAAEMAERMRGIDGAHRVATLVAASGRVRAGDYAGAREVLAGEGGDAVTAILRRITLAWSAVGLGLADEADAELTALGDDPLSTLFAEYHRGLIAARDGDHEAAVSAYDAARDAGGGLTPRLAAAIGRSLERLGRPDTARALYEDVLADAPFDPAMRAAVRRLERGGPPAPMPVDPAQGLAEAMHGLGSALSRRRQEGARFALLYGQLAIWLAPDLDEARMLVGGAFDTLDQHEAAARMFGAVLPDGPVYPSAQIARASALDDLGRIDEALASLDALSERRDVASATFYNMADILSRAERYEECVQAYDNGFAALEDDVRPRWIYFFGHGICLERTGRWPEAEQAFVSALALEPDQPNVLNYLGYSLIEQGVRLEEALEMIERAVAGRPDSGYIVDSLGWAYYRLGDFDAAVRELERAVALTPVEPVINDHLGDAYWIVGRKHEARFQWRRALSFEPEEKDRERILRKLEVGLDVVLEEESAIEAEEEDGLDDAREHEDPVEDRQGG